MKHLYFLSDGTASMGAFLTSLSATLKQVIVLNEMLFEDLNVHVIIYRDYDQTVEKVCLVVNKEDVGTLKPIGGGDHPEAHRTGFNKILEMHDPQDEAMIIHYTDAIPHSKKTGGENFEKENEYLTKKQWLLEWNDIRTAFKDRNMPVYTFIDKIDIKEWYIPFGKVFLLSRVTQAVITDATMKLIMDLSGNPLESIALQSLSGHDRLVRDVKLVPPIPLLERDLAIMTAKFKTDPEFKSLCFKCISDLLTPDDILMLTYNPVVGKIWRLICQQRSDDRLDNLRARMGTVLQALKGDRHKQMKDWLDNSFDETEHITELIHSAKSYPYIMLDGVDKSELPTKDDFLSLARSPNPQVLKQVQKLLTQLIVVQSGTLPVLNGVPHYLPLDLASKDFFSILSHLISPGIRFSKRQSALLALLCVNSENALLMKKADSFLNEIRGTWLNMDKIKDIPELVSLEFVKLMAKNQKYLTAEEHELYGRLMYLNKYRSVQPVFLRVKLPFTPKKTDSTADLKSECVSCKQLRSFSILHNGKCSVCLYNEQFPKDQITNLVEIEKSKSKSCMVKCRTCQVIYAVVRSENLNVGPKCHPCRSNTAIPKVQCTQCKNCYLYPDASQTTGFKCPHCRLGGEPTREEEIRISDLFKAIPSLPQYFGIQNALHDLLSSKSFYKLLMENRDLLAQPPSSDVPSLVYNGSPVIDSSALVDHIKSLVNKDQHAHTCELCFEDVPPTQINSACGKCNNRICNTCATSWYGGLQPGALIALSRLTCPFCKRIPKGNILSKFNKQACTIVFQPMSLKSDWYYGWCLKCYKVQEAIERVCGGANPQLSQFVCAPCSTKSIDLPTKSCPDCHATTIKDGGCDHISCTCGSHWCWRCGKAFDYEVIYDHMIDTHGSIGLE